MTTTKGTSVANAKSVGYALIVFSMLLGILLVFVKANTDQQGAFLCEKFHENQLDMQQCPAHKSSTSWLLTLAFGTAFLILGAGIYLVLAGVSGVSGASGSANSISIKTAELPEEVASRLGPEEKAAYEAVKNAEGSAYQSDLIKATGFSKVKMTRVLDRLESKGIIERKRRGMTNIVVLK